MWWSSGWMWKQNTEKMSHQEVPSIHKRDKLWYRVKLHLPPQKKWPCDFGNRKNCGMNEKRKQKLQGKILQWSKLEQHKCKCTYVEHKYDYFSKHAWNGSNVYHCMNRYKNKTNGLTESVKKQKGGQMKYGEKWEGNWQ